ncbi:MAG TPA: site-specific integrase [Gemmataceae bacterium]|jgi:integrase|nr:site-specific integrase [Gemmataceae bacterium]
MPRTNTPPKYRLHRARGRAVVTLTDPSGKRKDYYLGQHGSAESKAEYARLIGEWAASGKCLPNTGDDPADLTVNELAARFWKYAIKYYRNPDGTPAGELENYRYSLRPLKATYGHSLARDFGPLALKAVRDVMVDSGLARPVVNRRVSRIKNLFRWAVAEQLVPVAVHQSLLTVTGLTRGRTEAPEPEPIQPVADEVVEQTLPAMRRHLRGLIQFMRLTGARPGEACQLRRADIDMSGEVWSFRPASHKGAWRGKSRTIPIGPRAQAVLAVFPTSEPDDFVFSPATDRAERALAKQSTRPARPLRRRPQCRFTTKTLHREIQRACERAGVDAWHPNQLRHSRATEVRRTHGLEAAQCALGHTKANTTEIYALRDHDLAVRVALETG